jgi:hypothetical protein
MQELLPAFAYNEYAQSATARTDNGIFWSYNTVIAVRRNDTVYLSKVKYSATTSGQQNAIKGYFNNVVMVDEKQLDVMLKLT